MYPRFVKFLRSYLIVFVIVLLSSEANSKEVKLPVYILTSYQDGVFLPYKKAFEIKHPDVELFILNKKTSAAISYIQDKRNVIMDVFWASSPDAFEILKNQGKLVVSEIPNNKNQKIHGYPINDSDGYYQGFAISGYGIMWNTQKIHEFNLPIPQSWEQLTLPIYANQIGITAPSRSGTTHIIIEIILQNKNWQKGWHDVLKIAGNLKTITARSFSVRSSVEEGYFSIGLVIDFFALMSQSLNHKVGFIYPQKTALLPASIALVKGGENKENAQKFIEFVRSEEGQKLLFLPALSRYPINEASYQFAPKHIKNPFQNMSQNFMKQFYVQMSQKRYHLVNSMFDQLITRNLESLKEAWRLVYLVEEKIQKYKDTKGKYNELSLRIITLKQLILTVPVTEQQSLNSAFNMVFSRRRPGIAISAEQIAQEKSWKNGAKNRYELVIKQAEEILMELANEH
ncbi:MAG: extracellular solute-binding protein [Rhizobiales bacterium]|nr:extracellular solute-binding protein [Hyphomicrobiales bacterium]